MAKSKTKRVEREREPGLVRVSEQGQREESVRVVVKKREKEKCKKEHIQLLSPCLFSLKRSYELFATLELNGSSLIGGQLDMTSVLTEG